MHIARPLKYKTVGQRRPLWGVGINDADYAVCYKDPTGKSTKCPYYAVWAGILERCFSKKLHEKRPTYAGCTLDPAWELFSNFKKWMESQDWQGKVLDKDLVSYHQKHYGPDTCLFISHEINNLLTLRANFRGNLPLGVSTTTMRGHTYFIASCSFYGKQKRLGYFKEPEKAAEAYKTAKLSYIAELAAKEKDPRVRQALQNLF